MQIDRDAGRNRINILVTVCYDDSVSRWCSPERSNLRRGPMRYNSDTAVATSTYDGYKHDTTSRHKYTHTHTHVYIYTSLYMCVWHITLLGVLTVHFCTLACKPMFLSFELQQFAQ